MINRWNGHRLMERAREAFDDSRDFAREGAEDTDAFIHERPVLSTVLGLGAGVLIGMVYGSFRSKIPAPAPRVAHRPRRKTRRA